MPPRRRALHRAPPGRLGGGSPGGPPVLGTFFRSLQTLADLSLGKTAPRQALPQRDPHLATGRTAPGPRKPRCRGPLPCLSPILVFLSVLRTVHGERQLRSSRGRSAGRGGVRPPEPPRLPATGAAALPRAESARSPAEGLPPRTKLKTGSSSELSPFFFLRSLLPPFPSSLLPPSPFLSPFFPSPSLSHSPAFTDGTASHCVFMYIIRQLVPSTSFASLQYLYKHITLSVACTFCYGCCHSLRDLTFIF